MQSTAKYFRLIHRTGTAFAPVRRGTSALPARTRSFESPQPQVAPASTVPVTQRASLAHPSPADELAASVQNATVHGVEVPPPCLSFASASLDRAVLRQLESSGLSTPTPVQAYALSVARAGRDFVGISPTGSGKTLAFVLPAIQGLLQLPNNPHRSAGCLPDLSAPAILILSPTRELARQTADVFRSFGAPMGLKAACLCGGAALGPQLDELSRRPHVVVATPHRLLDIMDSRRDALHLSSVRLLVIDEADTQLELGSEAAVREVGSLLPFKPQVMMTTATWPKGVASLASDFLGAYVRVALGVGKAVPQINYNFVLVKPADKMRTLHRDLTQLAEAAAPAAPPKTLVFVNERADVDFAVRYLYSKGIEVGRLHSDLPEAQRTAALRAFRSGEKRVLVATNIAARGLDVPDIDTVINVDFPDTCETFLHRCGRTGRASRGGNAVSYLTLEDGAVVPSIINALESAGCAPNNTLVSVAAAFRERRAFAKGFAAHQVRQLTRPKYREGTSSDAALLLGDDDTVVQTLQQQQQQRRLPQSREAPSRGVTDTTRSEFLEQLRRKYLTGEEKNNTFKRVQ